MRTCVIFNPIARGEKARRFRRHLAEFAAHCSLKQTASVADARRLASESVREGFEIIAAAGGDGTVNEVLNGIVDEPEGLQRARLAVLPLGTVNVFARELGIPRSLEPAWRTILAARESRIDLPGIEYSVNGTRSRRHFIQLAGAGLDARAIELVEWQLKKKIGPLAYVVAGLRALFQSQSAITVSAGDRTATGELVLIGNGRRYGGEFRIFPRADLRDGLMEVCVFPRANWMVLARCGFPLLLRRRLPSAVAEVFQAATLKLTSGSSTPFEVDGELIGHLPANFSIQPGALRVIVP